jgi:Tol biopolymer transport system component
LPRFSPDGRQVAYFSRKHVGDRVLHAAGVCGRDGADPREMIQFDTFYKGNRMYKTNCAPCWSPDGRQFVWLIPREKTLSSTIHCELLLEGVVPERIDLFEKGIRLISAIDWR